MVISTMFIYHFLDQFAIAFPNPGVEVFLKKREQQNKGVLILNRGLKHLLHTLKKILHIPCLLFILFFVTEIASKSSMGRYFYHLIIEFLCFAWLRLRIKR